MTPRAVGVDMLVYQLHITTDNNCTSDLMGKPFTAHFAKVIGLALSNYIL